MGERNAAEARTFLYDLRSRLSSRVQLTTDGHNAYLKAVPRVFGNDGIDYAILQKLYGPDPQPEKRYSPAVCIGAEQRVMQGDPDPERISTSYVERQNLTMRMGMRRYTRLTNALSKKVENLVWAVSLHFMHYNFAWVHQTLKTTPAMAAGVADHRWSLQDIAALID